MGGQICLYVLNHELLGDQGSRLPILLQMSFSSNLGGWQCRRCDMEVSPIDSRLWWPFRQGNLKLKIDLTPFTPPYLVSSMASPQEPIPVKLFIAALCSQATPLQGVLDRMKEQWGPIDYTSDPIPFDVTDYYVPEMGEGLSRQMFSFAQPISPAEIVGVKLRSNELEDEFSEGGRRRINLDPGYMDHNKVVLPSMKQGAQKIYLDKGVWADPTLRYEKGTFIPFDWTFPDFKDGRYQKPLMRIRELYKAGIR